LNAKEYHLPLAEVSDMPAKIMQLIDRSLPPPARQLNHLRRGVTFDLVFKRLNVRPKQDLMNHQVDDMPLAWFLGALSVTA
jgi:hypothetical protein